jgi:hypothetical protein
MALVAITMIGTENEREIRFGNPKAMEWSWKTDRCTGKRWRTGGANKVSM